MRILLSLLGLVFGAPYAIAEPLLSQLPADRIMCGGGYMPDSKWLAGSSVSWNSETSPPPLTPSKAKQAAVTAFHKYMADYVPMTVEASDNVRLNQFGDQWCYTIFLNFYRSDVTLIGIPLWACVHVRMDGVALVEGSLLVTPEPKGLLADSDRKKAVQEGAHPPATSPESKPEGNQKPAIESKAHTQ